MFNYLRKRLTLHLCSLLGLGAILGGCRQEFRPPSVENELLVPLVQSQLSIQDIISDSVRSEDSDGLVSIAYRSSLYSSSLGSFDPLETEEFLQVAKLQSLELGSQSTVREVSLGQVALASGPLGNFIIAQNGNNAVIPTIPGLTYGPLLADGSNLFETVTFDSGYMDIIIQNNFPTGLSNVLFEVRNQSNDSLIGQETFASIPAGTNQQRTIDLTDKTVEGLLKGDILNFDIDGSGASAVPIDTNDKLIVTLRVRDTKVRSATAIFPAQNVIELLDTAALKNTRDLRGITATAASGFVDLRVVSTVEDTMFFDYLIPEGKLNGVPFAISEKIPPAPSGGSVERIYEFDVSGYTFDLTGQPIINAYNAFYSELFGRIDSTGRLVNLSLNDSILMFVKLRDFIPEYIEGYLGNLETSVGPEASPIDLFRSFRGGELNFEDIQLSLAISNENGVPFEVDVKQLEGLNSGTGDKATINLSGLPNPLQIGAADGLNSVWEETWDISDATDDLNKLINVFPDVLTYEMEVISNPLQDSNNLMQFAVDSNLLNAFIDLEMPLSLSASGLMLVDTIEFDGANVESPEEILSGTLYLIGYNGLPLEASMKMTFYDQNFNQLTDLTFENRMLSAQVNSNGKATEVTKSVLEWEFVKADLDQILRASFVIAEASFDTETTDPVKIYSTDQLELTLSGKFNYLYGQE